MGLILKGTGNLITYDVCQSSRALTSSLLIPFPSVHDFPLKFPGVSDYIGLPWLDTIPIALVTVSSECAISSQWILTQQARAERMVHVVLTSRVLLHIRSQAGDNPVWSDGLTELNTICFHESGTDSWVFNHWSTNLKTTMSTKDIIFPP